ncbi:MAG: hypothetical protein WA892_05280 [Ornithinimicrobium sp.]
MAQQTWKVEGRVEVRHTLLDLQAIKGGASPLEGITVKVQARSKVPFGWGTWSSWGQVRTDADGEFSVTKTRGSDRRQFRIRILFDDDRLRLKEGDETTLSFGGNGFPVDVNLDLTDKDWFVIHDDRDSAPNGRRAGTHDFGTLRAEPMQVRRLGDLWVLIGLVLDDLDRMGPEFGLDRKQVVKFPMGIGNGAAGSNSYSNPVNGTVYIKQGEFAARTIIHELMHQWAYDRTKGEDGMAWQLAKHQTTHAPRENTTFVPFHEAFADWAPYELLRRISDHAMLTFAEDNSDDIPGRPYSRAHLGEVLGSTERSLDNVDYTERGWRSLFTLLTWDTVDTLDFDLDGEFARDSGQPDFGCRSLRTGLTFKQVLEAINIHPDIPGADTKWRNRELNFDDFLARAQRVHEQLTDVAVAGIKECLDPQATGSPCDNAPRTPLTMERMPGSLRRGSRLVKP